MENENIFERVKSLYLRSGEYAVVSGGVLEAHDIRKAHDIDLVVTQELFDHLAEEGWQAREGNDGSIILYKDDVEVATNWSCNNYDPNPNKLIAEAETINGCAFIRLDEVIKFKEAMGRDKDKRDLELIKSKFGGSIH